MPSDIKTMFKTVPVIKPAKKVEKAVIKEPEAPIQEAAQEPVIAEAPKSKGGKGKAKAKPKPESEEVKEG